LPAAPAKQMWTKSLELKKKSSEASQTLTITHTLRNFLLT
jgi:hypothetical protein